MANVSQKMALLGQLSNLLVRSPSCSCVLQDILELIVEYWGAEDGVILVFDERRNRFVPLVKVIKSSSLNYLLPVASRIFSRTLQGCAEIKTIKGEDAADLRLVSVPFWGDNRVIGVCCLLKREDNNRDEDIDILQVIVNQVGISLEKELAREKINNLKYSINSIFDSLMEGIIIGKDKVIYINRMANILLNTEAGFERQEISKLYQHIIKMSKNPLKTEAHLECSRLMDSNYSFDFETRDGKFLRLTKFHVKNSLGNKFNTGLLISDITKHRETEKMKNDLISVVSHELRTPLTSIKGNISSLLRKDIHWNEELKNTFLEDIYDECNRLSDLIEKLLDISSINAGILTLNKELITLQKFMQGVRTKICNLYCCDDNRVTFNIEDKDEVVEIDRNKIQQVLLNLIDNAIKHGNPGVKVECSVRRDFDRILFTVKDDGPGMEREHLKKIFEKFYQIKAGKSGTGLGLAICKGIIAAHGGTIWAESTRGKGSSFFFTLPPKTFKAGEI